MENYKILGKTYYRYQFSVLHLAEYIHCLTTGAIESWEPLSGHVACEYLKKRLKGWNSRNVFDMRVKALLEAAISEYENSALTPTKEQVEAFLKRYPKAEHNLNQRVVVEFDDDEEIV